MSQSSSWSTWAEEDNLPPPVMVFAIFVASLIVIVPPLGGDDGSSRGGGSFLDVLDGIIHNVEEAVGMASAMGTMAAEAGGLQPTGGDEVPIQMTANYMATAAAICDSLSLVTIFFLGWFVLFSKTQPLCPRSTPSPEATGVGRLKMQKAMPQRRPTHQVVFFTGWFDSCQPSVCTIPM